MRGAADAAATASDDDCRSHGLMIKLFVYGTLQRGQYRHNLIDGQKFLGDARTAPHYRLYVTRDYPAMVEDFARGQRIEGELFLIDASLIDRLDYIEGHPRLFRRDTVLLDNGQRVWTYLAAFSVIGLEDGGTRWP